MHRFLRYLSLSFFIVSGVQAYKINIRSDQSDFMDYALFVELGREGDQVKEEDKVVMSQTLLFPFIGVEKMHSMTPDRYIGPTAKVRVTLMKKEGTPVGPAASIEGVKEEVNVQVTTDGSLQVSKDGECTWKQSGL